MSQNAKSVEEETFSQIYLQNSWGNPESVSGDSSTLHYTENLRRELPGLFESYGIRTVLDAPCGDYNWMQHVVNSTNISYIGGDIVALLVEENNRKYGSDRVSFVHLDITSSPLPAADLMIVRDCLFHLSYRHIEDFLRNLLRSDIKYLLTTTHINENSFSNNDIGAGDFRLIDLYSEPFHFPAPLTAIDDWIPGYNKRQMCLWSTELLRELSTL